MGHHTRLQNHPLKQIILGQSQLSVGYICDVFRLSLNLPLIAAAKEGTCPILVSSFCHKFEVTRTRTHVQTSHNFRFLILFPTSYLLEHGRNKWCAFSTSTASVFTKCDSNTSSRHPFNSSSDLLSQLLHNISDPKACLNVETTPNQPVWLLVWIKENARTNNYTIVLGSANGHNSQI